MKADTPNFGALLSEFRALKQCTVSETKAIEGQQLQIESYLLLLSTLHPQRPFLPMESFSIAPDLGLLFASRILEMRPALVFETGSGISTLIAGYYLKKNGFGRIISIEHDAHYLKQTEKSIHLHGLGDYVQLVYAPLVDVRIRGRFCLWYETSFLQQLKPRSLNLVLIDGPPGYRCTLARYPAMPVLFEFLADDALIVVDDASRPDELEMVSRWQSEFPALDAAYLNTAKGTCVLNVKKTDSL